MTSLPTAPLPRYAWTMPVRDGCAKEYVDLHQNMGPEMRAFLTRAGYQDYSIFLKNNRVFGCFSCADLDQLLRIQAKDEAALGWRRQMAKLVENDPNPKTGGLPMLRPIFHHP